MTINEIQNNIVDELRVKNAYDIFRQKLDDSAPFYAKPIMDWYLNTYWSFDKVKQEINDYIKQSWEDSKNVVLNNAAPTAPVVN